MENAPDAPGSCMQEESRNRDVVLWPGEVLASAEQSAAAEAGELQLLDVQEIADK
jgi:hypothetical protein